MAQVFEQSQWIWKDSAAELDDYAEFTGYFSCETAKNICLNISADSNCNVYINGELVFFKQFSDYPWYKLYDSIDISPYCRRENEIRIAVWYYGKGNLSYYLDSPGLIFEIVQGERLLLSSSEQIQSRTDIRYKIGYGKGITTQLGFSFFYDNTVLNDLPWCDSVAVQKSAELFHNPLQQLTILDRTPFSILRQDSHCALIDLGCEEAGFLALELDSPVSQVVTIAYGEHIVDGGVRRIIGQRDFSVELRLKQGENTYQNTFRRLAGRYLEIFYEQPVKIQYLGLLPVMYPVKQVPFTAKNELQQRIYDTSVRTLMLSMHEHYEDCPWREQALYVMDSRNQMLCGYCCFENSLYARQNLILMSKGVKEDGLLEMTYPAKDTPAIPFFTLMYPQTIWEYVKYTGDESILPEVMPTIERIMQAFDSRISGNGLLANLPYPYWNFYEWSEGSDHEDEISRKPDDPYQEQYDLILNCIYLLAQRYYGLLTGREVDTSKLKAQIHRTFYNKNDGMYFASTRQKALYTELGNCLALLAGVVPAQEKDALLNRLKQPNQMVKLTLSMLVFKYDALLLSDPENKAYIMDDILKNYGIMLDAGATSFWETAKGESDFDGAGSLCHGWSAIAVYYFNLFSQ